MSDSLLEHLEKLNDLVQDVVRENTELKARLSGTVSVIAGAVVGKNRNNRKKLTAREVRAIREYHRLGTSQRELADIYDVNQGTISRIVRGIYHK